MILAAVPQRKVGPDGWLGKGRGALERTNRHAPLGQSRSISPLGRQGETPLRIASLDFEFCTFAPTAPEQFKAPSSTADTRHWYAKGIAQLLQNEMIAALLQEFSETTAANAAQGKVAIGLIFNDANRAIRLIGNLSPLDPANVPRDRFERTALFNAVKLNGTPYEAVE
jgi:hypothetical protein